MRLPIIPIGNSKGIRIPQAILKQCRFREEVELEVDGEKITLTPSVRKKYDMTFENIAQMNDQDIIEMLKRTDVVTLAIALIGADDATKQKIYANMSRRARALFSGTVAEYAAMDARQLIVEMHRARINRTFSDLEQ